MIVLKRKYDELETKYKRLEYENKYNLKKIKNLNIELLEFKEYINKEIVEFSSNLEKFNNYKREFEGIKNFSIIEIFEFFKKKYKFDVKDSYLKYREFSTEEEAQKWGKDNYENYSLEIEEFQRKIKGCNLFFNNNDHFCKDSGTRYYCDNGNRPINLILRKICDDKFDFSIINFYKHLCNLLIFELLNSPKILEDIIVYRVVDGATFLSILESFNNYKKYIELGFLSTNLLKKFKNNSICSHYSDYEYVLKIYVPKGNKALYTRFISENHAEHELLFPNNSILKPLSEVYFDRETEEIVIDVIYEEETINSLYLNDRQ